MHVGVAERAKVDEFCYGLLSISESQTLGQSVENIGMLKRLAVVQPHCLSQKVELMSDYTVIRHTLSNNSVRLL